MLIEDRSHDFTVAEIHRTTIAFDIEFLIAIGSSAKGAKASPCLLHHVLYS
jgi:hypothetical protein